MTTCHTKATFYGLTGLVTLLAMAADANFGTEKQVKTAQQDLRWLDTALQTFFIDNNSYPAWTTSTAEMVLPRGSADGVPSFKQLPLTHVSDVDWLDGRRPVAYMLTTPVGYLNHYPADPFAGHKRSTYAYLGDKHGFLIWSPGPDRKYDIKWKDFETTSSIPDNFKIMYTYDPSNGAISSGDIWRASTQH